jgi:hypothetical protein
VVAAVETGGLSVVSRVFRTFGFELSGARYWLKQ